MIAAIDCGTTKTRVILTHRNGDIISRTCRFVGAKDTNLTGSKEYLVSNLEEMIHEVLEMASVPESELELIVASGMITSEIGLMEIPHLVAPVNKEMLGRNIRSFPPGQLLNISAPVLLIPGVRTNCTDPPTLRDVRNIDFMRGEEVQSVAAAEQYYDLLPLNLLVLSSHTKIVHISADKEIVASCTTMSGQVFESLTSSTLVGGALTGGNEVREDSISEDELSAMADETLSAGFLRAVMIPRLMKVLLQTTPYEREAFFNATIASDDMQAVMDMDRRGYGAETFVLFGHEKRCHLYERLLKKKYGEDLRVIKVSEVQKQEDMTLHGTMLVLNEYLKNKEIKSCLR